MIIFVIPAYNEEKNIGILLSNIQLEMLRHGLDYKVIVIDDGSKDRTVEVANSMRKDMQIELFSHRSNMGIAAVFRSGFKLALETSKDGDVIITTEADNTNDLSIIIEMIKKIEQGYDLVLGSCYAKYGKVVGVNFSRLFLSKMANLLVKIFCPINGVNTYSSFYRAYNPRALRQLRDYYGEGLLKENGFECMVELLIKFSRFDMFKITEIPMVLDGNKRVGKSKMHVFKTTRGFTKVIFEEGVIPRIKNLFSFT